MVPRFLNFASGLVVKNLPVMQETKEMWVQRLGLNGTPEEEMATHSIIFACKLPRIEEPGGLQSMWSQRVGHD